jgi:hypothetical protein
MSATFIALMLFKNKHRLNEEVLPLLCLPCKLNMYISVSNKLTLFTALKLSSGPKTVLIGVGAGVGVGVLKVSLDVEDSSIVTLRCS